MTEKKVISQEEQDTAQRMAEAVNLHVLAGLALDRDHAGYVAIRLSDGRSVDGVMYDTRADAVRHNRHDQFVFYVRVGKETMPVREALIVLQMARMAFRRGVIFAEEEVVTPQLTELMQPFIPRTLRGTQDG